MKGWLFMEYFKEAQTGLFEDVLRAEANYAICNGAKNKLATILLGQMYEFLDELNLTEAYLEFRAEFLKE